MATTPPTCKDCRAVEEAYQAWTFRQCCDWQSEGFEGCPDCPPMPEQPSVTVRKAPYPGPRCSTHHHKRKRATKAERHAKYVARTYSLAPREYETLYVGQGGVCAICTRATGATRKLSVDHDHKCCSGGVSCGYCVRGLLCRPCNDLLGHARDDWQFFARAIKYLNRPPALDILKKKRPDIHEQAAKDARVLGRWESPPSAGPDETLGDP